MVGRVLGALRRAGAQTAEPGALLERARIDPIRKEAYGLLPHALTELAARVLLDQARGALSRAIREGRDVLATASLGIALAAPRRLVLAGRPNAGKSTLFNAVVASDRVLVSEEAGTTRDPVTETIAIEGVPFRLTDTAGVGEGRRLGLLETLSVARAREEIDAADLVLFLHDASAGAHPEEEEFLGRIDRAVLRVAGKADLGGDAPGLPVSAKTGEGLDALRAAILEALGIVPRWEPGAAVVFTQGQKEILKAGRGPDLLAYDGQV
ncbi:MAG: GTPase [Planctomycetota bacterium]